MMQNLKDSFYLALRDRLAELNPERTLVIGGQQRPAIVVAENELVAAASPLVEVFHLNWSKTKAVTFDEPAPLLTIRCDISYCTEGTDEKNAQDRGRILAELDAELFDICRPGRTEIEDPEQGPSVLTGNTLFWSLPELGETTADGRRLSRSASVELFAVTERRG